MLGAHPPTVTHAATGAYAHAKKDVGPAKKKSTSVEDKKAKVTKVVAADKKKPVVEKKAKATKKVVAAAEKKIPKKKETGNKKKREALHMKHAEKHAAEQSSPKKGGKAKGMK